MVLHKNVACGEVSDEKATRVRNQPTNTLSHECLPARVHQGRAWTCCAIERRDAQGQIQDGGHVTGKQGRFCADGIRTTFVHARCCHHGKWQHHAAAQESKQQQHDSDPHRHDFPSLRSLPLRFCQAEYSRSKQEDEEQDPGQRPLERAVAHENLALRDPFHQRHPLLRCFFIAGREQATERG